MNLLTKWKHAHKLGMWKPLSCVWLFATPWTIQSMEFTRPEYWSGQPFHSPGDLPNPGIEPRSPTLWADSLPAELQGKLKNTGMGRPSLRPGDLPDPGIDPGSPALQEDSLPTELWGKFYFWGFKITADGDCSHEIKKLKVMTKLDSILKSRDIALPKKAHLVKAMVFPVVRYGWESWIIKKAECWRIGAFELWCWRRLLRVPWTARRSNQSILKEISPGYSLEELVLKKTLESSLDCKEIQPVHPKGNQSWIFIGRIDAEDEIPILWPPDVKTWLIGKDPDAGKDQRWEKKGTTEDEMVGWHHQLNGHEFEKIPGDSEGQGSLAWYSPWDLKESDMT